jgi:Alpha amylase, catalytic domain
MRAREPRLVAAGRLYQIYPRSFRDASGDGLGDLRGIHERVDFLAWPGVDAIWLSPICPTEDVDLGYDISDYCAVDPRLGTLEDFDRLLDALHEKGVRLVLDLVPNHTSDRHPWFLESRSSADHPRHDWYVWREPTPDGSPPNNWQSYFGDAPWEYADPPGKWYLHSLHRGQPDLNWDNPAVAEAIQEAIRFWLSCGWTAFASTSCGWSGRIASFGTTQPTAVGTRVCRPGPGCSGSTRRTGRSHTHKGGPARQAGRDATSAGGLTDSQLAPLLLRCSRTPSTYPRIISTSQPPPHRSASSATRRSFSVSNYSSALTMAMTTSSYSA